MKDSCHLVIATVLSIASYLLKEYTLYNNISIVNSWPFWNGIIIHAVLPFVLWSYWSLSDLCYHYFQNNNYGTKITENNKLKLCKNGELIATHDPKPLLEGFFGSACWPGKAIAYSYGLMLTVDVMLSSWTFIANLQLQKWQILDWYLQSWKQTLIGANLTIGCLFAKAIFKNERRKGRDVLRDSLIQSDLSSTKTRPEVICRLFWMHLNKIAVMGCVLTFLIIVSAFAKDVKMHPLSVNLAEELLLDDQSKNDFRELAIALDWNNHKVCDVLRMVLILNSERHRYYQALDPNVHKQFRLSLDVDDLPESDHKWRHLYWGCFKPLVEGVNQLNQAVLVIKSELQKRVRVIPNWAPRYGPSTIWSIGFTNQEGWERCLVAALRACGIAARLTVDKRTEFWDGGKWIATSSIAEVAQ